MCRSGPASGLHDYRLSLAYEETRHELRFESETIYEFKGRRDTYTGMPNMEICQIAMKTFPILERDRMFVYLNIQLPGFLINKNPGAPFVKVL